MHRIAQIFSVFAIGLAYAFGAVPAAAVTISPDIQAGVRDHPTGGLLTLIFFAAKDLSPSNVHDHGILEFDITSLSGVIPTTTLDMTIRDIDFGFSNPGGEQLDIYDYFGDGLLTTADFTAGTFFTSIVNTAAIETISVDVTSLVQSAVDASQSFLGIRFDTPNFNTGNGHRYDDNNGVPAVLTVSEVSVPEPNTLALLALGLAGIGFSRRRTLH